MNCLLGSGVIRIGEVVNNSEVTKCNLGLGPDKENNQWRGYVTEITNEALIKIRKPQKSLERSARFGNGPINDCQ